MLATFWMTKKFYVRLLFKQDYRSYKESSCIMDKYFDSSHVTSFLKMSMKIPYIF
jgi:hypothetical protein